MDDKYEDIDYICGQYRPQGVFGMPFFIPGVTPGFPGMQPPFGPPLGPPGGPPGTPPFGPGTPPFGPGGPPFGPPGGPPFGPPPGGGAGSGPPGSPPPSFVPQLSQAQQTFGAFAVDPGAIRPCIFRFVYIWLANGQQFWAWLIFVGRTSAAGWRWTGRNWVYFGVDLLQISAFICY